MVTDASRGPGLEFLIRQGMQGDNVDIVAALLQAELVVPSGGAVEPDFSGFVPVLYDRDGVPMLAVFTSLERASSTAKIAPYAVTMTGRDVIRRMPAAHGLVVNPGHAEGFEMLPPAVQAAAER
ncbi:SseB family protein [Cellulomonas sp. NPDC058312]|uniref:SseB family protein n=1 Tax=Cellulomonas sp. NPDC058312 TaxID=3346441 RepID=UPI0036EDE80F